MGMELLDSKYSVVGAQFSQLVVAEIEVGSGRAVKMKVNSEFCGGGRRKVKKLTVQWLKIQITD